MTVIEMEAVSIEEYDGWYVAIEKKVDVAGHGRTRDEAIEDLKQKISMKQ